ncbi:HK97 family phage prohead protease [Neisseria sp. Ec49-e6-T10]|uniref:HK97 family phage prohead protease n=1 Tax=Neisseria sp. Ec49-e6-T10 TaxID=3140744 RepID=UPI003EBCF766
MNIETKEFNVDIKQLDDNSFEWEGYVAAYGNIDSYGDVISPGAGALNVGKKLYAFWEHRQLSGALEVIKEDEFGLFVKGEMMPDDILQEDLKGLGARLRWLSNKGIQLKMSIGYVAQKVSYDIPENLKGANRIINQFKLMEGSIVLFPANENAVVTSSKSADIETPTMTEQIALMLKNSASEIESKRNIKSLADMLNQAASKIQ